MSVPALRALIVDDEPVARDRLCLLCVAINGLEVVGTASDGLAAMDQIAALSPDLILLDIAMPGLNGMGVANAIMHLEKQPAIIFCTAYDRHALAAFEVSAVDYLLKPVPRDRLARAVDKIRLLSARPPVAVDKPKWLDHLWVLHRGAMLRIALADIDRIDAERDYVRLGTGVASYLLHDTLTRILDRLDPEVFVRLRRSALVRRSSIRSVRHDGSGAWTAHIADGSTIRIGPTYLADLKLSFKV